MTTLTDKLLAVEVPFDAHNAYVVEVLRVYMLMYKAFGNEPCAIHIGFKCNFIGTVTNDEIDFDCEPYVEEKYAGYKSYNTAGYWLDAKRSFHSLLLSKGLTLDKKYVIIEKL